MSKAIFLSLIFLVVVGQARACHAQLFFEYFDTYSTWAGGVGTKLTSKTGEQTNGWQKGVYVNLKRVSGLIGPLGLNNIQGFDPEPAELPPQGWAFRDITGEVNPNGNYMIRALIRSDPGAAIPQNISFKVGEAATTFTSFANSNELTVEFLLEHSHYAIDLGTLKNGVYLQSIPSENGNMCSDQGISSNRERVRKLPKRATPCRLLELVIDPDGTVLGEEAADVPNHAKYLFNYDDFDLWFEALMNVNTNNATTTLWLRDVNDTTGEPLEPFEQFPGVWPRGFGSTVLEGLPFSVAETAGIRIARAAGPGNGHRGASLDNFISGHPLLANKGDFDGDGDIDGDGFLIWQNSFPTTNGTAISFIGDATGDGKVDGEDFLVWQNIFPFSVALSEAPEPASLGMLALGNLLMWPHRLEAR